MLYVSMLYAFAYSAYMYALCIFVHWLIDIQINANALHFFFLRMRSTFFFGELCECGCMYIHMYVCMLYFMYVCFMHSHRMCASDVHEGTYVYSTSQCMVYV